MDICYESGYTTAFTKRGNEICYGNGYTAAYTIRGNEICYESGYTAAYTIRGNEICYGSGYTAAYTIRNTVSSYGGGSGSMSTTRYSGGNGGSYRRRSDFINPSGFIRKTVFLLITLSMQSLFLNLWQNGIISAFATESLQKFAVINVILLGNSLVCGLICRFAKFKIGRIISGTVNFLVAVGIIASILEHSKSTGDSIVAVIVLGIVELIVIGIGDKIALACYKDLLL